MEGTNIDESWYGDFFVEDYTNMINELIKDCHCFPPHFINIFNTGGVEAVERFINRTVTNPLFSFHTIIFTTLKYKHWTITITNNQKHTVKYYDSFGRDDKSTTGSIVQFLQKWQEHEKTTPSNWKVIRAFSPPQTNTFDCGPWILQTAKCIALHTPLNFNQNMMQSIRIQQKMEVQNRKLYPIKYSNDFNKHKKNKNKIKKQVNKKPSEIFAHQNRKYEHKKKKKKIQFHNIKE